MAKIIFLGTSGAVATKTRDNTSIFIQTKKDNLLVDLPGSVVKKLSQVNFDFKKLSYLLFTHAHPDHIYGIISLLHSQYKLKNKLYIFAHSKVINLIKKLRKIFKLTDTNKYPKVIYRKINLKKPFYDSRELSLQAFKVKHSQESVGFKLFFKKINKSVVFSGDTAFNYNLIKIAFNCDYLIHDCFCPERFFKQYPELYKMHTSSLLLGKIASLAKVKNLIPIHFASEVKYSLGEILNEIKKNYSGKVIIPEDLGVLKI